MSELSKTLAMWIAAAVLFVSMCAAVLLTTPSPFVAVVEQTRTLENTASFWESGDRININTAEMSEWLYLPKMERKLAVEILTYRYTYGRFARVEDLLKVDGVTQELLDIWYPYITCY